MVAIANMVDFVLGECVMKCPTLDQKTTCMVSQHAGMKSMMMLCYALITITVVYMYDYCWRPSWTRGFNGFSFVYFVGSCFQLLGLLALCMKIKASKTGAGISSQSLLLHAMSLSCRVFSTTIYDGYLPVDKSGDMWVQIVDACSLVVVICTVYMIHKSFVHTYQEEKDDFSIWPIVCACVTSAFFIRGDLNRDPVFDVIWTLGLNFEIFQMLPQLYMLTKMGGFVENTTAHYVVNIFMGCVCKMAFWLWAAPKCSELTGPTGSYWEMNLGGFFILGAHAFQILVMCDFMYYYVKAMWMGEKRVFLPSSEEMI